MYIQEDQNSIDNVSCISVVTRFSCPEAIFSNNSRQMTIRWKSVFHLAVFLRKRWWIFVNGQMAQKIMIERRKMFWEDKIIPQVQMREATSGDGGIWRGVQSSC